MKTETFLDLSKDAIYNRSIVIITLKSGSEACTDTLVIKDGNAYYTKSIGYSSVKQSVDDIVAYQM